MRPVSIINHNTVIPKNTGRYRETFNTVVLPKNNTYKITSITCKIDTTSLWNIRQTNVIKMVNTQNQTVNLSVTGGYFDIDSLCEATGKCVAIDSENLAYKQTNKQTNKCYAHPRTSGSC